MEYTAKTEDGKTIVQVSTDKRPTHCIIDAPGASQENLQIIKLHADAWLKNGGALVLGGSDPMARPIVSFPGHFTIEEHFGNYMNRFEGTTLEETLSLQRQYAEERRKRWGVLEPDAPDIVEGS